ncbi:branched-chain-amino-acid aminotransferase [Apiospora arundinis]
MIGKRELGDRSSTSGFLGHKKQAEAEARDTLVVPRTDNAIASATSDAMVRVAEQQGWVVEHG